MLKRAVVNVVSIFVLFLFAGAVFGTDLGFIKNYSADLETKTTQGSFTSKIFYKDTKMRMESNNQGHNSISILRPDKKVMWILMVDSKTYMEMQLDMSKQDIMSKINDPGVKVDYEFVANEVVDKHPCKKYHMTITSDGKKEKSGYVWKAADLNEFAVKYESEDKKVTTVYKNIKIGGVADSVFDAPSGYKKMDMPGMGAGARKQAH